MGSQDDTKHGTLDRGAEAIEIAALSEAREMSDDRGSIRRGIGLAEIRTEAAGAARERIDSQIADQTIEIVLRDVAAIDPSRQVKGEQHDRIAEGVGCRAFTQIRQRRFQCGARHRRIFFGADFIT
jgi:hypothetical protein